MECRNCGFELKQNETSCPICQTPVHNNTGDFTNSNFEYYKETESINEQLGFKNMLIFSVLELICCNQLFGIGALLILLLKFKPAVDARNLDAAKEAKKTVNIVLIIGVILSILVWALNIVLTIFSELQGVY